MMLASMLAIVGHGAAMAMGIDRCAHPAAHEHAVTAEAGEADAGHADRHHAIDLRTACCQGACALAMIVPEPADASVRAPGAMLAAILAPQGLDPRGIERPPRV